MTLHQTTYLCCGCGGAYHHRHKPKAKLPRRWLLDCRRCKAKRMFYFKTYPLTRS